MQKILFGKIVVLSGKKKFRDPKIKNTLNNYSKILGEREAKKISRYFDTRNLEDKETNTTYSQKILFEEEKLLHIIVQKNKIPKLKERYRLDIQKLEECTIK